MSVDESKLADWQAMQARNGGFMAEPEFPLKGGGGSGTYDGMEGRVARLEAYMEVTRDDLKDIKGDVRAIKDGLAALATKGDLETWKWQWVFIALAVIALTVAGITGGLALIAKASSSSNAYVVPQTQAAPDSNQAASAAVRR